MHDKGPHSVDHRQMEAQLAHMQSMSQHQHQKHGGDTEAKKMQLDKIENIRSIIQEYKTIFGVDSICRALQALARENIPGKAIRIAQGIPKLVPDEVNAYCDGIQRVIKEQEDALAANEMWVERETGCCDYIEELEKADQLWLKKEARRNKQALETMRRLVPVNLVHCNPDGTHMTEKRLLTSYADAAVAETANSATYPS